MWVPAWAWVISAQDDFAEQADLVKNDPRAQRIIIGEYLLMDCPNEDVELACVRWLEQAKEQETE